MIWSQILIKSPETYTGQTTVTPSTTQQILQTKNKLVTENVTVGSVPLGILDVTENGKYYPVDVLGFSEVNVDVPLGEWSASVLIYEGDFEAVTNQFSVTELPDGQPFSFDRIVIELSHVKQGQNVNKRTYWRSDKPMSGYNEPLIIDGGSNYRYNVTFTATTILTIDDDTYISLIAYNHDENNPISTGVAYQRKEHGGYNKITGYGWWSWNCPAGSHIKIIGYNRTS